MSVYNLTENQKKLIKWIVQEISNGNLDEEFRITRTQAGLSIAQYRGEGEQPIISDGILDALATEGLIIRSRQSQTLKATIDRCTVTGKAYEAVKSNFNAPDTSFLRNLTPLEDVSNFDNELKQRCFPILGAGSADPKLWDSAVRTAGTILEERLRDVGGITDTNRVGRNLVNDIFGRSGTLASKFLVESERDGCRDLYAGAVGVFRNPSAHRLIDPTPEDGGAIIVFINFLLKKLENLR
jgi:hypothetical protein